MKLSADILARYYALRESRREEEARQRAVKKEEDALRESILSWLQEHGRNAYTTGGYTVATKPGRRTPSWQEIVRTRLGPEVVAEVIEATEPSIDLVVTPVAS